MNGGVRQADPRMADIEAATRRVGVASQPASPAPGVRSSARLADIEVLRAIAVLMVLYEHLPINLVFWNSRLLTGAGTVFRGWVGVDLFFAISGFVIARGLLPILARQGDTDGFVLDSVRFWLRRAWRLLPTAWLWLVVPPLLCLVSNRTGVFYDLRTNLAALVAGVLDVENFRVGALYGSRPIGMAFPYWSLSLEEQFYLALPLAAFLFRRWLAVPLLGLVVLQFAMGAPTPLGMMLRPAAICFGVLLAMWEGSPTWDLVRPRFLATSRLARAGTLGLLVSLLLMLGSDGLRIVSFRVGMIALLSAVLVWIASYGRGYLCRDGWLRRRLVWLAARSYAIYVIHVPVYLSFHEVWHRLHPYRDPHGRTAVAYVGAAFATILLLAWVNDRLYADRLRRYGAGVAVRFGRDTTCR